MLILYSQQQQRRQQRRNRQHHQTTSTMIIPQIRLRVGGSCDNGGGVLGATIIRCWFLVARVPMAAGGDPVNTWNNFQ